MASRLVLPAAAQDSCQVRDRKAQTPGPKAPGAPIKRRQRAALQQGDLDGLCGVYAIVNAVRVLCREVTQNFSEYLFDHLVRAVTTRAHGSITQGVKVKPFHKLVRRAVAYVRKWLDIRLDVRCLASAIEKNTTIDGLWAALQANVDDTCIALVELSGRKSHWTAVGRVTNRALHLVDSSALSFVKRSSCTVERDQAKIRLSPQSILLISRP